MSVFVGEGEVEGFVCVCVPFAPYGLQYRVCTLLYIIGMFVP